MMSRSFLFPRKKVENGHVVEIVLSLRGACVRFMCEQVFLLCFPTDKCPIARLDGRYPRPVDSRKPAL